MSPQQVLWVSHGSLESWPGIPPVLQVRPSAGSRAQRAREFRCTVGIVGGGVVLEAYLEHDHGVAVTAIGARGGADTGRRRHLAAATEQTAIACHLLTVLDSHLLAPVDLVIHLRCAVNDDEGRMLVLESEFGGTQQCQVLSERDIVTFETVGNAPAIALQWLCGPAVVAFLR